MSYSLGLCCNNLRFKTFGAPDPFIKLSLTPGMGRGGNKLPHHRQSVVTLVINNSCNPSWTDEVLNHIYIQVLHVHLFG